MSLADSTCRRSSLSQSLSVCFQGPKPKCDDEITECSSAAVKLLLFLYSFSIRKHSSRVQVLWEDHRNDLYVLIASVF